MYKKNQLSGLVIAVLMFAAGAFAADEEDQTATENETPAVVEKTVRDDKPLVIEIVGGHYDYCLIDTIEKRTKRNYEEIIGGLLKPNAFNSSTRCEGKTCLGYFHAGKKSVRIQNVDLNQKSLTIWAGLALCMKDGECDELKKKEPEIFFLDETDSSVELKSRKFGIKRNINFDEMYDADGRNVDVSCPANQCKATIYESDSGPMFYLETQNAAGGVDKKLIVNLDMESRLTESQSDFLLKKCQTSVEQEDHRPTSRKKAGKK